MRKFSTPQRKIPWGGVSLCKRIAATVVAVVMGVCGSGVAAWAKEKPSSGRSCSRCESTVWYFDGVTEDDAAPYTTYYGVEEIPGLSTWNELELASYYNSEKPGLLCAAYNDSLICVDCLEEIISSYSPNKSGSTQVTAEVSSSYSIIVPQAITLDGSGQSGTYSKTFAVTVKGDIGENQQVTVTATPPTMKCTGCADVAATFTAGYKTTWNRSEAAANSYAGTAANYTVSATLTPGEWTGTATFACSLGGVTETPTLISFTIGETTYQAEDGMTWEEWVESSCNTDGWYVNGVSVLSADGTNIVASKTPPIKAVSAGSKIDNGTNYGHFLVS